VGSNPIQGMDIWCVYEVCVHSVFVLSYAWVEALRRTDHSSKESYRLWIDQETEKAASAHKACTAIKNIYQIKFVSWMRIRQKTNTYIRWPFNVKKYAIFKMWKGEAIPVIGCGGP
jgi:hypothetical protein